MSEVRRHPPRVAVYTIARDAEDEVQRWAASAHDADLLLIADTGSSDATVARGRELGVQVHEIRVEPFRFDDARNRALELVGDELDVCISLDLDEVLLAGWRTELERVWSAGAAEIPCTLEWRWSEVYPPLRYTTRRIHARHGYRWRHPVHEQLVAEHEGSAVPAAIEIRHLRDPSRPTAANVELLRLAVAEEPGDARLVHMLANELRMTGDLEEARGFFRDALGRDALGADERLHTMLMLARLEPDHRQAWLIDACRARPERREGWCELAQLHLEAGRWRLCRATVDRALRIETPADDYLANVFAWGPWPERMAATASIELGDAQRAAHHARRAWETARWDDELAQLAQRTAAALTG